MMYFCTPLFTFARSAAKLLAISAVLLQVACTLAPDKPVGTFKGNIHTYQYVVADSILAAQLIVQDSFDRFFEQIGVADMLLQMRRPDDPATCLRDTLLRQYRLSLQAEMRSFSHKEARRAERLLRQALSQCAALCPQLQLPPVVLIKCAGQHYGPSGFYTRQNCIVVPQQQLTALPDDALLTTLLHEIFHVWSRYHPSTRPVLYQSLGYRPIPSLELSPWLRAHRLLNPDGVDINWAITVTDSSGRTHTVVPSIYTESLSPQSTEQRDFFDYLAFGLFQITFDATSGRWEMSPSPPLAQYAVTDFQQQTAINSGYIIHPDETLADNFAMLASAAGHSKPTAALSLLDARGKNLLRVLQEQLCSAVQ